MKKSALRAMIDQAMNHSWSIIGSAIALATVILMTNARTEAHFDARFEATNAHIQGLIEATNARIDDTNARIDDTNARIDRLEVRMDAQFEQVDRRFEQVDRRFEQVDRRLDQIINRLGEIVQGLATHGIVVSAPTGPGSPPRVDAKPDQERLVASGESAAGRFRGQGPALGKLGQPEVTDPRRPHELPTPYRQPSI